MLKSRSNEDRKRRSNRSGQLVWAWQSSIGNGQTLQIALPNIIYKYILASSGRGY